MSKTILSKVDGFTPLPDILVTKYGRETAAVWGSAWRYCQMNDGICRAAIEKIGKRIGLSRQSTQKHMNILVNDGFFEDTTPELKNKPHIYRDTGKVGMYNRFGIGVNLLDSGVKEIDSDCQVSLHEDSIKETTEDTWDERKQKAKERKERQAKEREERGGLLGMLSKNAEHEQLLEDMYKRVEDATGLDVTGPRFEDLVVFLINRERRFKQTIEKYAEWMENDPYNSPKKHQIAQRPDIVRETWLSAFQNEEPEFQRPEWKKYVPEEGNYVPNPNSR